MHRVIAIAMLAAVPFLGGCAHRQGGVIPEMECPPPAEVPPGHVHGPGCGHMRVAGCWVDYDAEFAARLRAWHMRGAPLEDPAPGEPERAGGSPR
jgi:hypothetical protein